MASIKEDIERLANNGGFTLKKYRKVQFKTGYQVATEGIEVKTVAEACRAVQHYKGSCGVWYSEGVYYVDKSFRISTKSEALMIAANSNQKSILKWSDMSLIWL